jgi:hypothetical protein
MCSFFADLDTLGHYGGTGENGRNEKVNVYKCANAALMGRNIQLLKKRFPFSMIVYCLLALLRD